MIQLATDPNASRNAWRAAAAEARDKNPATRRPPSHAWPFISRHTERAAGTQDRQRTPNRDNGS